MTEVQHETWGQIVRRHEIERISAIRRLMGGSMQEAADTLGITKPSLDSFLRYRGLRWSIDQVEAAYPEVKEQHNGKAS